MQNKYNTKYYSQYNTHAYLYWALGIILAIGVAFLANHFLSRAQTDSPVLSLQSLTSFICPNPGANSPGNPNYGISVFTGSGNQFYTECGHLDDIGYWDSRSACNGPIAIGGADTIATQGCTLTGITYDNRNVTLTVNVPEIFARINGNMRLFVDNAGGTYYCQSDHDFATSAGYPNDCDLTPYQAVTPEHQITSGTPACGNNFCQTGETVASCPNDCAASESYGYSFTRTDTNTSGVEYGIPRAFNYTITQIDPKGGGTDSVYLQVLENGNSASWCSVNPSTVSVAGFNGTAAFTITCTPSSANLGSPSLTIHSISSMEVAAGRPGTNAAPLTFSVIAPVAGGGGTVTQQCYRNTTTGIYVWFPSGTAGSGYTAADSSNCSGGGGTTYFCYQNDANTQRTLRANSDSRPLTGWRVVAFTDCSLIPAGETKNISELTDGGGAQLCYHNANTGTYSWFPVGTAGALWGLVDSSMCSPTMGNQVNHTWNFKDGTTSSMIMNRTDTEYANYIAQIHAQCLTINMSQFAWKPSAGDSSAANWQNFGIPDCPASGVTPPPVLPPVSTGFTCYLKPDGTYVRVSSDTMVMATWRSAADSFCSAGTEVPPYTLPPIAPPPIMPSGECASGSKCSETSWCNMGQRCHYPDGQITCTSGWDAKCPAGTALCRPGETKCIEPGAYGPLDGWCMNAMECFTKTQKYCSPMENAGPYPQMPKCPSGTKYCFPDDPNCIEPGGKGPINGWCKNGQNCYLDDGSGIMCVEMQTPPPVTIGVGMGMGMMSTAMDYRIQCPAGSGVCRPDDSNCLNPGETGPSGAWCGDGAQRCNKKDGTLYCPKVGEGCPADTSLCPINDSMCTEPGKYGPANGWCASSGMGAGTVMCYKSGNIGIFCGQLQSNDPKAWETFKCPAGTSRCRDDDKYCLEAGGVCEIGTGCWCASGMPQYKDGRMYCMVSGEEAGEILHPSPPEEVKPNACVVNPDYNDAKQEEVRLDQMEKSLNTMTQSGVDRAPIRAKIEAAHRVLLTLLKIADETSCGAKNPQAFGRELKKFREAMMADIEQSFREFGFTGDIKNVQREIEGRLSSLAKDLARFEAESDTDAITFLGNMVTEYKTLLKAAQSEADGLDVRAIQKRIMAFDQEISDFFASRHYEGNQEFLGKAIAQMRDNLKAAREKLGERVLQACKSAGRVIEKIAGMVDKAESVYNQRNIPEAGKLLDQARKDMQERMPAVMGRCMRMERGWEEETFDFDLNVDDAFNGVSGVDDDLITTIVEKVTERMTLKIQLFIDAQLKEVTARIAELVNVAQEKITQSLVALQAVSDEYRAAMTEAKTAMIEKTKTLETLAQEAATAIRTADRTRLYNTLETVSSYNWCGRVGDDMRAEADNMIMAFEEGTVSSADIIALETHVKDAAAKNMESCYQAGISRFRDTPTHEWYFPHFQIGVFQGTQDTEGHLTGYVEPGRESLGAEAMITIMRAAEYRGVEGTCPVPVGMPGANDVPTWSTCAFNIAASNEFVPPVPLDAPIPRQYVAEMMVNVAEDRGLADEGFVIVTPEDAPEVLAAYSDIRTCEVPDEAIATMVANGIMTGNPDGTWNCDGNLNRAELATILARFEDAMEFYGGEEVAQR